MEEIILNIHSFVTGTILGLILGIFGNRIYDSFPRFTKKSKFENFKSILNDKKNWSTDNGEVYIYSKDPSYKIIVNEGHKYISPRFSKFPDRNNDQIVWVTLKYDELSLYGWNFMYLDGARIFIPVPDSSFNTDDENYDFYNLNDNYMYIFRIIGCTSGYNSIEQIAALLNIEINSL